LQCGTDQLEYDDAVFSGTHLNHNWKSFADTMGVSIP
jgi:hypothetical protein